MADNLAKNEQATKEEQAEELRRAVANAYAFVIGQEATESFSCVTFEELLDQQIQRIESPGTDIRPNVLDRIRKTKEDLISAIDKIRQQPDDFFKPPQDEEKVVT